MSIFLKVSDLVQGGYIPVQGGYIPVQGGYIPVRAVIFRFRAVIFPKKWNENSGLPKFAPLSHALRSDQ